MAEQKDFEDTAPVQVLSQDSVPQGMTKEFSIAELEESISKTTRNVMFELDKTRFLFYIVNLSEKKKYGSKSSEKLDEKMRSCSIASLTLQDNNIFLPSQTFEGEGKLTKKEIATGLNNKVIEKKIHSGISKGKVKIDEEGNYVRKSELTFYTKEGIKLKPINSSLFLKNSQNKILLKDIVNINGALDFEVLNRYVLFPHEEKSMNLLTKLLELENEVESHYYSFPFNYYESYEPMNAFLQVIKEDERNFILMNVGRKIEPLFIGRETKMDDLIEIEEDFEFDLSI